MRRTLSIPLLLCLLAGCGDEVIVTRYSRLDRAYPFVACVLKHDDARQYRQEVFVGRVLPHDDPPPILLGEDTRTARILLSVRATYRATFEGYDDATVTITDDNGAVVQMTPVGNGYYRDINDKLDVVNRGHYRLQVEHHGSSYTAETTVPGAFSITSPCSGDTVLASIDTVWHDNGEFHILPLTDLRWTPSAGVRFYNRYVYYLGINRMVALDHTFSENDGAIAVASPIAESIRVVMEAIDTNYARIYAPEIAFSGSEPWMVWYSRQEQLPLAARSSIAGPDSVMGAFGSIAEAQTSFWGIAEKE